MVNWFKEKDVRLSTELFKKKKCLRQTFIEKRDFITGRT